jgi:hypothetical protein
MRLTTDYAGLFRRTESDFEGAVEDTLGEAKRIADRYRRTGKFAGSLQSTRVSGARNQMNAVIGSPLVSARVKEKGGYIQARKHPTLYIPHPDGGLRTPSAVRIRATPIVTPAGAKFVDYMSARLRRSSGGAR